MTMGAEDIVRARIRVDGRVQGVCFRMDTCAQARRLGLVGWVKNCDDGSVEIEAEGIPRDVAALHEWCHYGPPLARVARLTFDEMTPQRSESDFTVRYGRG